MSSMAGTSSSLDGRSTIGDAGDATSLSTTAILRGPSKRYRFVNCPSIVGDRSAPRRPARHKRYIVEVIVGPTDAIIDRLPDVLELMPPTLTSCPISCSTSAQRRSYLDLEQKTSGRRCSGSGALGMIPHRKFATPCEASRASFRSSRRMRLRGSVPKRRRSWRRCVTPSARSVIKNGRLLNEVQVLLDATLGLIHVEKTTSSRC